MFCFCLWGAPQVFWANVNADKEVLSPVVSMLRDGGGTAYQTLFPLLPHIVASLPEVNTQKHQCLDGGADCFLQKDGECVCVGEGVQKMVTHTQRQRHTRTHTDTETHIHTRTLTYTHALTHTHTHTHTHTQTHTHTDTHSHRHTHPAPATGHKGSGRGAAA